MTSRTGRYAAGAATGLAIALSLTACTGTGKAPANGGVRLTAAQDALAKVSTRTGDLTSFRGAMSMAFGMSGQDMKMKGVLAYRFKPSRAMKFTTSAFSVNGRDLGGLTEILVGDTMYMKAPGLKGRTGKPWLSLTLSRLGKSSGVDLQSMEQGGQGDPRMTATMLTASKDVRQVGQETVAGVPTTHYKGTYSLADGLAKLDAEQRAQAQKAFGAAGMDTMNFEIWVDGQRLPRKVVLTNPPGTKLTMKMTMNYTGFNAPVSIAAPPKSQVTDRSGLMGGGGTDIPG